MLKRHFLYRPDDGLGGGGTAAPAVTPATPSPTAGPPALDPMIYNPEGQPWKDLYNGTAGGIQSLKSQHTQALATVQAQVDAHLAAIQERDATITQFKTAAQEQAANAAALAEQAKTIPDLLQRAGYADRLEILMQFPKLVASTVAQEVPGAEGAAPTTIQVNPYLELIATTTLSGDALRKQLSQLAGAIPEPTITSPSSAAPVIPPQPTPSTPLDPRETLKALGEKMRQDPTNMTIKNAWMDALAGLPSGEPQQ